MSDADSERIFRLLRGQEGPVRRRLIQLFATGKEIEASSSAIAKAMETYLADPTDNNFETQKKVLLCNGLDLPDSALKSNFTAEDIVDLAGELQVSGGEGFDVLRDPKTWNLVRLRGRSPKVEAKEFVKVQRGKMLGVPPDTLLRLNLDQLMEGAVFLQQNGLEGALGDPGFWDRFTASPDRGEAHKYATGLELKAEQERERKLNEAILKFNQAAAKAEAERAALDAQREEDKRRKILEKRKKKKKPRPRIRGEVTTNIDEIEIYRAQQVATPWGSNYVLVAWHDGTSVLIRIGKDGGAEIVLKRDQHAYQVSKTPGGMMHVVPVIGRRTSRRPASPLDRSEGQRRGPAGIDVP